MLLFPDSRPLVERLGPDFFRTAPTCPGVYLMRDSNGTVLKNQFILIGDPATGKKATLWLEKDVIEAIRFMPQLAAPVARWSWRC